jgi:hypothetical protein
MHYFGFIHINREFPCRTPIRYYIDMGWTSFYTKQHINVCRLLCRILRSEDHILSYKIYKWISRRRKGWAFEVDNDDTFDVCFPTDKKYLHALFCTDEMILNVLVPHTPLPYINIGSIMDVYSLLYTPNLFFNALKIL